MSEFQSNERGVSLVEILAAIVLLSIVLFSFYAFFINSATFTTINKKKLTAVDIAEQVVSDLRKNTSYEQLNEIGYHLENGKYINSSRYTDYSISLTFSNIEDIESGLLKVLIEVSTKDTGQKSKSVPFRTEIYWGLEDGFHEE